MEDKDTKELFQLKYPSEIVDLFIKFQEISKSYGSFLFQKKGITSNDLLEFLNDNVYIHINEQMIQEELVSEE